MVTFDLPHILRKQQRVNRNLVIYLLSQGIQREDFIELITNK